MCEFLTNNITGFVYLPTLSKPYQPNKINIPHYHYLLSIIALPINYNNINLYRYIYRTYTPLPTKIIIFYSIHYIIMPNLRTRKSLLDEATYLSVLLIIKLNLFYISISTLYTCYLRAVILSNCVIFMYRFATYITRTKVYIITYHLPLSIHVKALRINISVCFALDMDRLTQFSIGCLFLNHTHSSAFLVPTYRHKIMPFTLDCKQIKSSLHIIMLAYSCPWCRWWRHLHKLKPYLNFPQTPNNIISLNLFYFDRFTTLSSQTSFGWFVCYGS